MKNIWSKHTIIRNSIKFVITYSSQLHCVFLERRVTSLWIDIESRTSIRYNRDLYTYCEEEKNTDILPANYCIYLLTSTFAVIKYLRHYLFKVRHDIIPSYWQTRISSDTPELTIMIILWPLNFQNIFNFNRFLKGSLKDQT